MTVANPLSWEDRELLTAYLDGELPETASKAVEDRLAVDERLRHEFQELSAAWDALGALGESTLKEDFTRTTMELVAQKMENSASSTPFWTRVSWIRGPLFMVAAAGGLGFFAARLRPHPDSSIARQLPLLRELEVYETVPNVEFLRKLAAEGLFVGVADSPKSNDAQLKKNRGASATSDSTSHR